MAGIPLSNHSPTHLQNFSSSRRGDRASVEGPDFALELSGGLESESNDDYNTLENIVSLDPEVLASLVIQLRTNLSTAVRERNDVRGERDHLIRDLAIVQTRLHELEGTQEREVEYLNEMAMWRKRCEEAEEQIGMLRGKVEESRRAVMTLQTQSRRLSQLSVPYASSPHAQTFGQDVSPRTPAFQKRMSLQAGTFSGPPPPALMSAPPKGRGQRRSSVSDQDTGASSIGSQSSHAPSSFPDAASVTSRQISSDQEAESSTLSRSGSRRHSAMLPRPTESLLNPLGAELELLRQELITVRVELMETKQELWESNEAKEASDVCLKALKDFIAENSIGASTSNTTVTSTEENGRMRGLSLPPLPTDKIPDAEEEGDWSKTPVASHAPSGSVSKKGWGLGFWGSPTAPAASSSTVKGPSNDTVVSHSSPSSAPVTKSPTILAPTTAIGSFVSRWRTGTTSSPTSSSPSSTVSTASPQTTSSPHSFSSAFNWGSSAPPVPPPSSVNDNYTPAPAPRAIRRRPSAYSSPGFDGGYSPINRKGSAAFDKRDSELQSSELGKRDTIIGPIGALAGITSSPDNQPHSLDHTPPSDSPLNLHRPYLDSTPSLTDTETTATTNPSSGSEHEPESPRISRGRLTPSRNTPPSGSFNSPKKSAGSLSGSSGVRAGEQRRASSTSSRSSSCSHGGAGDMQIPPVPPLPLSASPRAPEFTSGRIPLSPSVKNGLADLAAAAGLAKALPVGGDGRRRVRSRAPSMAVNAGAAMETIDESAVEKEKQESLTK